MTGPGSSSASRMRIAGIVLLAIAGVAAVVGLISLAGGSSPTSTPTAAPTSVPAPAPASPEVPLPGATGTTPPAPGLAPSPGTPGGPVPGLAPDGSTGQPGAGGAAAGGAPGNGSPPVAAAPIVPPADGGSGGGGSGGGSAGGAGGSSGGSGGGSGGSGGGSGTASVRSAVPVHVLNNSLIRGLAERAADQIRSRGWNVVQVGNLPNQVVPSSVVYFRPGSGDEGAARALASDFGIRVEGIVNTQGLTVVATSNWPQGSPKG